MAAANNAYKNGNNNAFINDPAQLPEIQSQLQSMSQGAVDPVTMYMQNVNKQFYGR
jgi:hypothetical protein